MSSMRLNGGRILDNEQPAKQPGFTVKVLKDGSGLGNTEPLIRTMNTLMTAGSWETLGPFGNRAPAIVVEVEGQGTDNDAKAAGLNAGEVWLQTLMRPGTLEWLPTGQKVWTVFDVVWCYLDRSDDADWAFMEANWVRRYRIPIKALPHARSPELTYTDAAPTSTIVDTLITDCSTTARFTASWERPGPFNAGTDAVTPTNAVAGWVRATTTTARQDTGTLLNLRYSFASAVPSATPYVRVDVRLYAGQMAPTARWEIGTTFNGTVGPARQNLTDLGGGVIGGTVYYRVPTGTTALTISGAMQSGVTNTYIEVDQIRLMSRLPDIGSLRQKFASITPGGSAPADGSLHVANTVSLGKTIVYTYPLGRPSPSLMQFKTSGTTPVADTAAVNNERVPIQSQNLLITIPDLQLPTRGRAALWAKVQVDSGPAVIRWALTPTSGGFNVGQAQTRDVAVFSASVLVPLGLITLPGAVTGASGAHTLTLRNVGSGVVSVDEVWAFGMDDYSALTIVDAGTGTPASGGASNNLWINAPSPTKPAGEVLIGTSVSDARWPAVFQAGPAVHKFPAEGVSILVVTCAGADSSTDYTHYKRWKHNAAEKS